MKQRKEIIDGFGEIYILTISCPKCEGNKMIKEYEFGSYAYECQACSKDGTIDLVRYEAFKAALLKDIK